MKKSLKKAAIILMVSLLVVSLSFTGYCAVVMSAPASFKTGDKVEFGYYPKTLVSDEAVIANLDSQDIKWSSLGFYKGNGEYGSMEKSDYALYADVVLDGQLYRAVKLTEYRPYATYEKDLSQSYQKINGYELNQVYWFKYEPIEWIVLDPDDGYLLAADIIDGQDFNSIVYGKLDEEYAFNNEEKTVYANDYPTSTVREWLTGTFFETAFSKKQQDEIKVTHLDNSSPYKEGKYSSEATDDKVFLPSYSEMLNEKYGFSADENGIDKARARVATDYAKCMGVFVCNAPDVPEEKSQFYGYSGWYLRTPGDEDDHATRVHFYWAVVSAKNVADTRGGVVPAIKLELSALNQASVADFSDEKATRPVESVSKSDVADDSETTADSDTAEKDTFPFASVAIVGVVLVIAAAFIVVVKKKKK